MMNPRAPATGPRPAPLALAGRRQTRVIFLTLFSDLGLSAELVSTLDAAGFTTPTPIQTKAIPPQLEGRDILGIAQTGSGKTAAFGLPILAGLAQMKGRPEPGTARALILAPTRELAVQIEESLRKFAGSQRLSTVLVLGGMSRSAQVSKLARGVDVLVATPGRLKDLMDDGKVRLDRTRWLVLDEADRMLDMGFIVPVRKIAAAIGPKRQTALFSATMAPDVAGLAAGLLHDPVRVEAAPPATTVSVITQQVLFTPSTAKRYQLNQLLKDESLEKVIVFSRTKHGADRVARNLGLDGHKVAAIHGNKSQNARQAALKGFMGGSVRVLVATDIAARGIDVPGITHVINYELPDDAENYVHRIGRTGRNGASGMAITLCDAAERGKLRDIERLIRRTLPSVQASGQPGDGSGKGGIAAADTDAERPAPAPRARQPKPSMQSAGAGRSRSAGKVAAAAGAAGKAWWEYPTGEKPNSTPPRQKKPRWTKGRKQQARTRREESGPRTAHAG
jgi:ATP-dependent RNA helicase RhlE